MDYAFMPATVGYCTYIRIVSDQLFFNIHSVFLDHTCICFVCVINLPFSFVHTYI